MLNSTHTKSRIRKNSGKIEKSLYKLVSNAVYGKTTKNLRNRIDVKLVSNKKDYLKWAPKPSYMTCKITDNDLVAIRQGKVILTLNKPAYIGMYILELSKVLIYEFHYIQISNSINSITIIHRH